MVLRQQKVRARPGPVEWLTGMLVLVAVGVMFVGPMAIPGTDWRQANGIVTSYYRYQHPTSPDGRPYRVRLDYQFKVDGESFAGHWDGEWPTAHSPNALLEKDLDQLKAEGYSLVVFYDPLDPPRNVLHESGNRIPIWWLRLSIVLAGLVLWFVFIVYPRLKRSASSGSRLP